MSSSRRRGVLRLALILLLSTSCASRMKQFVPITQEVQDALPLDAGGVGVVEFDDQGLMYDTRQLDKVLADIHSLAESPSRELRLVIFVHGWKHDASKESSNFRDFPQFLEKFRTSDPNITVYGVYMAWRGEALQREEPLNRLFQPWLTFFSRIRAAGRVGRPAFTESLLAVLTAAELEFNLPNGVPAARDRTTSVVIGHSMGGFVVEEAMSKALLGSLFTQLPTVELSKWSAQQLINDSRDLDRLTKKALLEESAARKLLADLELATASCRTQLRHGEEVETKEAKAVKSAATIWSAELAAMKVDSRIAPERAASRKLCFQIAEVKTDLDGLRARLATIVNRSVEWRSSRETVLGEIELPAADQLEKLRRLGWQEIDRIERRLSPLPDGGARARAAMQQLGRALDVASNALLEAEIQVLEGQADSQRVAAVAARFDARALEEKAEEKRRLAQQGVVSWRPPADLILLLNPASRGIYARHTIAALKHVRKAFYKTQDPGALPWMLDSGRPWLIAVSSPEDWATRVTFPIGATLDSLGERFRDDCELRSEILRLSPANDLTGEGECETRDELQRGPYAPSKARRSSERSLVRTTATHNPALRSHRLVVVENIATGNLLDCRASLFDANFQGRGMRRDEIATCDHRYRLEEENWGEGSDGSPSGRWNDSGYWVIGADGSLITEHNDIFSDRTNALIAGLIRISGAFSARPAPVSAAVQAE